ncbi:unannotated protein [freshwater metagenome]|uniref:Unannotated protein n=1 Tax=freshwater metagenome TaxID=449393 RepID=A0A6J6VW77_9ZZZZ|nr:ComEC/Rec2 family competence protein [Actinomycetota bacterium]MSV63449.1 MBL fold metallo-hydrolase [Actinomycetota bacterium]MSW26937.1 MBL fold metallo-hydrolase [Actinomycetota bacterium]MSW33602.1 MBL fold metallo-hydrolase [Actinomycetota bacterium]MSX31141.1 MBL fold metallo-hydrolase [Actinomycetota bacterium]
MGTILSAQRRKGLAVVIALALLLGSGVMSLRQMSIENSATRKFMQSNSVMVLQVNTDPTLTKPKVFGSTLAPDTYSFLATALGVGEMSIEYHLRIPIRVITQDLRASTLLPGQLFRAKGTLRPSKEGRVAGMFLVRGAIEVKTQSSRWARTLGSIRLHLREISQGGDGGALIPGMVLGDTSLQSTQFRTAMRRSGLTHLTAVSGANFAIISIFVLWCMQWFFRTLRWRIIVTSIALAGFICLVRPSPSVLRAAAMASVVLFARAVGKRSDALAALGFAIAAVVIGDPWQARDPGFALSVLATSGLLLLAPRIRKWLSKFIPLSIAGALSVPIAAVVLCSPILVALSGYLGPMTIIANLLAAPVVAPITVLGFIAALFAPNFPLIAHLLVSLIRIPAAWIALVAQRSARFPVVEISTGLTGFLVAFIFLVVTAIVFMKRKKLALVALAFLLLISWWAKWPGQQWQVANCDVGQGDSMVINLGNHRAIVIDAGPDPTLEERCLNQLGVREIPLLVLSHFHADHVEGVAGLINHRRVSQVWVSSNSEPAFESARVHQWLVGVSWVVVTAGMSMKIQSQRGEIFAKVLWPDAGDHSFGDLPGDGSAINNSSIALTISSIDFSLFSGGDLEPPAQAEIASALSHVDIYKVCHHGSAYQDATFMSHLSPSVSIISVGTGNSYGHPAAQTIRSLTRLGSVIYRTDRSGAIAVSARKHRLQVRTSAGAWWQKVRLG